jgi:serine phosphatase RsbU (regulator of sigma subunit)
MKTISSKIKLLTSGFWPLNSYYKVFLSFSLFIFHFSFANAQTWNVDSLYKVVAIQKEDTHKVNLLNLLSQQVRIRGHFAASDSMARYALKLSQALNFDRGIANAYVNISNVYDEQCNYPEALKYDAICIDMYQKMGNKPGLANSYNNTANVYENEGNYPEALRYELLALKINEAIGYKNGIASANINLSNIYERQANYTEAVNSLNISLKICAEINDKQNLSIAYNNLGNIYEDQGKFDSALKCQFESLKLKQALGSKLGIDIAYGNIGSIYGEMGDQQNAMKYYQLSLAICREIKDREGMSYSYANMSTSFMKQKNYPYVAKYLDSALAISRAIGAKVAIKDAYFARTGLDSALGDFKGACADYKLYITYRDSLKNEANTKKLVSEQMQYEFDKKEAEQKALQDKKDVVSAQERKKQLIIRDAFVAGFMLVLALAFFIFRGYRQKQKANEIITKQKDEVEHQKELVEEKQKEILDSIHYAQRIQKALLASDDILKQNLPEYFVLFKPKDIVSGDFYWATKSNGRFYLAVCDSTGHGVPGAFMSLLNTSFMNEAINEKNITEPNEVFNHARKRLIENISQDGQQDGMDGTLMRMTATTKGMMLQYASAYNSPLVIKGGVVEELEADKMPVGASPKEQESFKLRSVSLQKGDCIYLFTDGFADQFGGEKGKKFKYKQLQDLLVNNVQLPMVKQKELLEKTLAEWQGSLEQTDDVCIVGIRI